jgi:arylsulfatase A-like enzyme
MRTRIRSILVLGLAAAAIGTVVAAGVWPSAVGPSGPNVVVIVADDLGFMDIAANAPGTFHETPNIDRLARMGMRFTSGYSAAPVCSPTRACLLTGKHPARLGITTVIATMPNRAAALLPAPSRDHLDAKEVTLAEAFQAAGYQTFIAGKWHLGIHGENPSRHGFDAKLVHHEQRYFPRGSVELPEEEDPKSSERIANDAVRFISNQGGRPFFAYLPFPAPHLPLAAPRELVEKYERKLATAVDPRPATANPVYAAMIEQLDRAVGRVLDAIEASGQGNRTIVIFTSDNGGLEGFSTSNAPLRAGKGTLYEGGIRVPLIVVAPGAASPGSLSDEPVYTADLYPTLLELASLPPRPRQHLDGASMVPALRGGRLAERPLYWHFPHYSVGRPSGAVRLGDWKLVESFEDGRTELFNLREDVGESLDRASLEPERAHAMHAGLVAWRSEMAARMPSSNPAWPTKVKDCE